jgi:hypothetical protein
MKPIKVLTCGQQDVTDVRLQPRIGWRNHWFIVNGYSGNLECFTGTRRQALKQVNVWRLRLQVREQLHAAAKVTANADFEIMRHAQIMKGLRLLIERGIWIRGLPARKERA